MQDFFSRGDTIRTLFMLSVHACLLGKVFFLNAILTPKIVEISPLPIYPP